MTQPDDNFDMYQHHTPTEAQALITILTLLERMAKSLEVIAEAFEPQFTEENLDLFSNDEHEGDGS